MEDWRAHDGRPLPWGKVQVRQVGARASHWLGGWKSGDAWELACTGTSPPSQPVPSSASKLNLQRGRRQRHHPLRPAPPVRLAHTTTRQSLSRGTLEAWSFPCPKTAFRADLSQPNPLLHVSPRGCVNKVRSRAPDKCLGAERSPGPQQREHAFAVAVAHGSGWISTMEWLRPPDHGALFEACFYY
jgi:hypothetical protein